MSGVKGDEKAPRAGSPAPPPASRERRAIRGLRLLLWFAGGLMVVTGLAGGTIALELTWEDAYWLPRFVRRPHDGEVVPARSDRWRVAVFGDFRGNDEIFQVGLRDMNTRQLDAAILLGDLVNRPTDLEMRHFAVEVAEAVAEGPMLGRLFFLPGNHDRDALAGLAVYEKYLGRAYTSFRIHTTLFVCLDTSTRTIDDAQRNWLMGRLGDAVEQRLDVYLLLHYPPNVAGLSKSDLDPESTGFLGEAIQGCPNVRMVLASHLHSYRRTAFAGVPLLVTGGGGARLDILGGEFHFLVLDEVPGAEAAVQYVPIADHDRAVSKKGRWGYKIAAKPRWIYWATACLGLLPLTALLWRRLASRRLVAAGRAPSASDGRME